MTRRQPKVPRDNSFPRFVGVWFAERMPWQPAWKAGAPCGRSPVIPRVNPVKNTCDVQFARKVGITPMGTDCHRFAFSGLMRVRCRSVAHGVRSAWPKGARSTRRRERSITPIGTDGHRADAPKESSYRGFTGISQC